MGSKNVKSVEPPLLIRDLHSLFIKLISPWDGSYKLQLSDREIIITKNKKQFSCYSNRIIPLTMDNFTLTGDQIMINQNEVHLDGVCYRYL